MGMWYDAQSKLELRFFWCIRMFEMEKVWNTNILILDSRFLSQVATLMYVVRLQRTWSPTLLVGNSPQKLTLTLIDFDVVTLPITQLIMKQNSTGWFCTLDGCKCKDYGNMSWSPIHAQLKQNSSKKCAGVGSLLAVHIGLGSLGLWFCIATNDLPAALTVTDDCDATAVWN